MTTPLNIVADAHIWGVREAFSSLPGFDVCLRILENNQITRDSLLDCDILLTRSATKVNAELLSGTSVRFAATATIGDDHYDKNWLNRQQIAWASAAGSSTGSVLEYMLTLLLDLHMQGLIAIPKTTIGIIGAGRIGGELAKLCRQLGMTVLVNDPPRARIEGSEGFCSLQDILSQADLITLHTPLIRDGEECTFHLLDTERLEAFKGLGIINAARGDCIDNSALLDWLNVDHNHFAALDCWEHEPQPLTPLIKHRQMAISSPHIAGHSLDGKAANTLFIYQALCRFLHIKPEWKMQLPPPPDALNMNISNDVWHNLHTAASSLYPLQGDHQGMQSWADLCPKELAQAFTGYRRHYPIRRAWHHCPIHISTDNTQTRLLADAIGLKLI